MGSRDDYIGGRCGMSKNVLVIGNGFDLYHFLPTRYIDFLRTVNRLMELHESGRLNCCQYIKYVWGPDSPIYTDDEYIRACYKVHSEKMKSVLLDQDNLAELVDICRNNIWVNYFRGCLEKNIGWIDFEKEIGRVLCAVQELFKLDGMTNDLVSGKHFRDIDTLGLKTIDLLGQLPFAEYENVFFTLNEEYCKVGVCEEFYVAMDKEKMLDELEEDLEELAKALCIYLREFVQKIAISKNSDNPIFYDIDKVLSFNYTDTYRKLYSNDVEIKFIHGSVDDEKGIVLGINNDDKDELENMDADLIRFKKYYQRAIKDTFYSVADFLNEQNDDYNVAIVGHSIDITDRDILVGIMEHPRAKITIYYHDDKAHRLQMTNLINMVGKSWFDELRNKKKVTFERLKEYKKADE